MRTTSATPQAYLVVRPGSGSKWSNGLASGFALVGIRRSGEQLVSDDGESIAIELEQRFMYPQDVARAVARGIAAPRGGVFVGERPQALASFPLLRAQHLADGQGQFVAPATSPPAPVIDPARAPRRRGRPAPSEPESTGTANSVAALDLDESTFPAAMSELDDVASQNEKSHSPEAVPATGAPVAPVPADSVAVDTSTTGTEDPGHPAGLTPGLDASATSIPMAEDGSDNGAIGEALSNATARLDRGQMPIETDLELLSESESAMTAVLERSIDLSADQQVDLADLAVFLLSGTENRALMYRWLGEVELRLFGQSNHLIRLMQTWLFAEPIAALAELRRLIRLEALSLKQRKPVEVAHVLREAARAVGDADALRIAYESLAEAPSRVRSQSALRTLIDDLEEEEGPSDGERRAIGLPIVLQAFRFAGDDDLAQLAQDADRYIRAYLRSDPPNLEAARLLEPIIEGAHDRAEAASRPSLQNTLRELRRALELAVDAPSTPTVAVTYEGLLRSFDGLSDNVEIVDAAFESARAWGKDGSEYLSALRDALAAVTTVADRYAAQEIGRGGVVGAFKDAGQVLTPGESDTALQDPRSRKAHTVRNRRGQPITLGPHLKFGQGFRLYLALDEPRRVIYVGRVGDHLPGKKSKNRPR